MATSAKMDTQTLVPAGISFSIDKKNLQLSDAQLSLKFTNGSGYDECMSSQGKKNYVLRRGSNVLQDGEITIKIVKTPEKTVEDDIQKLQNNLKEARTATTTENYVKDVAIVLFGPGGKDDDFFALYFDGYISELTTQTPELTNFMEYVAKVEIFNPASITLESKKKG
ncbi:hypothetical protein Aasi_1075 [Candidatus Amoebophilus asiaticus 5a2]|uniref:Uncharacterized protein n=1 Tax=Amoebophilus asiaticus (strain 5a2) TaxID=452471 RepID=B3ET68_AMOA5|nr:hypothetical protein [Candidatus Amoebophilus asiaticus]ACE06420.1 hypothetical protein Aasi_1075 [Candidatus Amoebophilus asiaticus 5a2]